MISKKPTSPMDLWDNRRSRALLYQCALILGIVILGYLMASNAIENLRALGIESGFDFLSREAGFSINSTLIDYDESSSYFRVFQVGILNTILISVIGIFFATILGFTIGIMRLSKNWLVSNFALAYVEIIRNVPLLLQIFLWFHATLKPLPSPRDHFQDGELVWFSLTNSGIQFPKFIGKSGLDYVWIAFLVAIALSIVVSKMARRRQTRTGQTFPVFWVNLGMLLLFPIIVAFAMGWPFDFEPAQMGRFRLSGGVTAIPSLMAMVIALSTYTAAFIAEVVRAGIQAIPKGQSEATYCCGLTRGQSLRLVIIPQAMRVIIPPLTNQYLNLTKNSSLAAAIAFPELVSVFAGTALNQSGKVFEILGMTLFIYLSLSLITSGIMNYYNRRVQLVER